MESDATHFALPLDDRYDCWNDDVAIGGILTFEVSYVVPSLQDVLANGSLQVRTDVVLAVAHHSVDGDKSRLETTSDKLQVQITDTLQAGHVVKVDNQMRPTARTSVSVYQDTYTGVPEDAYPDSSRFHDENEDEIRHQGSYSQKKWLYHSRFAVYLDTVSADEPGSSKATMAEHMNVQRKSWQPEHPRHALLSTFFLSNGFEHWDSNLPYDVPFSRLLFST
mmetsp:Transcript_19114/g.47252  ORF Transcript_19114/g.47252 Transcript_19114/m.47252 type:complete len:222 (-) Transcript_19114:570-1235(-)